MSITVIIVLIIIMSVLLIVVVIRVTTLRVALAVAFVAGTLVVGRHDCMILLLVRLLV